MQKRKNRGFFWLHDLLRSFSHILLMTSSKGFWFWRGWWLLLSLQNRLSCHHSSTSSLHFERHTPPPTCLHSQDLQSSQRKKQKLLQTFTKKETKSSKKRSLTEEGNKECSKCSSYEERNKKLPKAPKAHKEGNKRCSKNTMCEFISSLPKLGKKGVCKRGQKKNF